MALTERAMQAVQTPLRLVQKATGSDEELDRRLTAIERKLDQIHDDTQHIRTEQAAEKAETEG